VVKKGNWCVYLPNGTDAITSVIDGITDATRISFAPIPDEYPSHSLLVAGDHPGFYPGGDGVFAHQ
jgi:hypothetical protein